MPPLIVRDIIQEPYPPLGLAYIAAVLEREGVDVQILDAFSEGIHLVNLQGGYYRIGLSDDEIKERLRSFNPDVVGVSYNFTNFFDEDLQLPRLVKETIPQAIVVLGGAHVTMDYEPSISNPNVDVIVRGEGEYTLTELVERIKRKQDYFDVPGTVVKKNGKVVGNPLREPIPDLDALPMPAYHLLRMDIYLKDQRKYIFPFAKREPIAFMIGSRGCHFNCIFCSTSKVFRKFRSRSAEKIIEEIEFLKKEYGVKEIAFQDDCFLGDIGNVKKLCQLLISRKTSVFWTVPPGLPIWLADKKLLKLMRDSGCYRVCFPIESGCEKTLKFIRKPVHLKKAKETVDEANKLGLWTYGNLIIGFPNETKEEMDESIQYFMNLNLDMVSIYICQPYAGSDLYSVYVNDGLLPKGLQLGSYLFNTQYDTLHFTARQLNQIRSQTLSRFMKKRLFSLLTPRGFYLHMLRKIRSLDDVLYLLRILSQVLWASLRSRRLSYF